MTVNAITDTKKGRTGIAPTYLHTTPLTTEPLHKKILLGRGHRPLPIPLPAPHHLTAITGTNRRLTDNRISYQ